MKVLGAHFFGQHTCNIKSGTALSQCSEKNWIVCRINLLLVDVQHCLSPVAMNFTCISSFGVMDKFNPTMQQSLSAINVLDLQKCRTGLCFVAFTVEGNVADMLT